MRARGIVTCANGTTAYQPRVQPWEWDEAYGCVLKERRIVRALGNGATVCGVPSERGTRRAEIPRALPWAGMPCPVGAIGAAARFGDERN